MKKIVICILLAGSFLACQAQTNTIPTTNPPVIFPVSTASDIGKVFTDFGLNVSVENIGQVLVLVFFGARLLRKGVPDNMQTGVMGSILKHAALEINPEPAVKSVVTTGTK